jgi:hypothetical protein
MARASESMGDSAASRDFLKKSAELLHAMGEYRDASEHFKLAGRHMLSFWSGVRSVFRPGPASPDQPR